MHLILNIHDFCSKHALKHQLQAQLKFTKVLELKSVLILNNHQYLSTLAMKALYH